MIYLGGIIYLLVLIKENIVLWLIDLELKYFWFLLDINSLWNFIIKYRLLGKFRILFLCFKINGFYCGFFFLFELINEYVISN